MPFSRHFAAYGYGDAGRRRQYRAVLQMSVLRPCAVCMLKNDHISPSAVTSAARACGGVVGTFGSVGSFVEAVACYRLHEIDDGSVGGRFNYLVTGLRLHIVCICHGASVIPDAALRGVATPGLSNCESWTRKRHEGKEVPNER